MRLALIATLAVVAACNSIDTRDAENKAKQFAEDRVGPVTSVSCPAAKRKKGQQFTCKVRFEGEEAARDLQFTLIDDEGGWQAVFLPRVIGAERLAEVIAEGVEKDQPELGGPVVDCGGGILEVPDDGVVCHFEAGAVKVDLQVKVDDEANITWVKR